jgi:hypothetical protein
MTTRVTPISHRPSSTPEIWAMPDQGAMSAYEDTSGRDGLEMSAREGIVLQNSFLSCAELGF